VRFENKNIFFYFEKAHYSAGVEVIYSEVVGLGPVIVRQRAVVNRGLGINFYAYWKFLPTHFPKWHL
jgi:hypothetical protein